MKKVGQELGHFGFGDEVRNDEFSRSAFAVLAKPKCRPTAVNRSDGNKRPEDFEAKLLHGYLILATNRTVTRRAAGTDRRRGYNVRNRRAGAGRRPLLVDRCAGHGEARVTPGTRDDAVAGV